MKVLILYRPNSEHARKVEEFMRDFKHQGPDRRVETVSLDTPDGANKAKIYDIVSYPAFLALKDDGQLLKAWQGEQWPLMNELAFYASS